jgi:hypothetical protein
LAQTQPHHGGSVKTFQTRPWKAVFGDQKVLDMLSKRRGHSFETRPGLAGKPGTSRPGAGTGPGWRKNRGRKNQCDPAGWLGDPARPGQKLGYNPLTFFL